MKTIEHLTKEQLVAYAARSPLAPAETDAVEKHLLQCAVCRDALPAPTPEQFWSVLLDETEFDENFEKLKKYRPRHFRPFLPSYGNRWLGEHWRYYSSAGISFLIWRGASEQPNSKTEVAQTVETPKTENKLPTNKNSPVSTGVEAGNSNSSGLNLQPQPRMKQPQSNLPAAAENSKKPEETENRELAQLIKNTPPAVPSLRPNGQTTLRGSDNQKNSTSASPSFSLLAPVGETVLENMPEFRWEKAANARSYRISILDADFNEILTTEVSGNSFKLNKPLKPGAKYLWRVEAQTESGKIVAPLPPQPPAVFRVAPATTGSRIASLKKNENDRLKLAVFYAQEGMLDSAACALKEILVKNPKHKAARRLLVQVERWKKENNATVQRCGPSTVTKADQ